MIDDQDHRRVAQGRLVAPRQRLVLLMGAGSTIDAGAPSTDDITEYLGVHKCDRLEKIIKGLCEQRGSLGFNFETVMAAMEALEGYVKDKRYPPVVGGEMGAFTALMPGYEDFLNIVNTDSFFDLRRALLLKIATFVIDKTESLRPTKLSAFVNRLKKDFDLTVVTLNYDDLIDRAETWFDGFVACGESHQYEIFDHTVFRARASSEPAVLLHLHGSVRFGRNPNAKSYVVKYGSAKEAQDSFNKPPCLGMIPMITGNQKERGINDYAAPLGYYYNAFMNAALDCPLWLIAGYGGNDSHVNRWIVESGWAHQGRARIVHIDRDERSDWPFLPRGNVHWTPPMLKLYYGLKEGNFPPSEDTLNKTIAFLRGES